MSFKYKIWSVHFKTAPTVAEAMAEPLQEIALAVTVLAQPRKAEATIEALFNAPPDMASLTAQLAIIAMIHGVATPNPALKEMPKLDWLKKVAEDFPPLPIARWTVHGAMHRDKVKNRRFAMQIDATNAFGTGEHPTTRGCLIMLDCIFKNKTIQRYARADEYRSPNSAANRWPPACAVVTRKSKFHMLDMGCGSGILAMGAAQLYGGANVAVDLDPDSVVIAKNNANANGLRKNIRTSISRGYNSQLAHAGAPYDLIMANIFAGPLSHMAADLKRHLKPGGMVILAGLLNHQANRVLAAHRAQNLYLVKRMIIGEWSILALKRRKRA